MKTRAPGSRSPCAAAVLLVLACGGFAEAAGAHEGRVSINPNPSNARLVWAGEEYLVWQTSTVVEGTAARHLPAAVHRYYVQGHPSDIVPHVYEMTGRLGRGAHVLGVIGKEATLVLADYGKTILVNASEALSLPDPRGAVRELPSGWFVMSDGEPTFGDPLAAYDEGVLIGGRGRLIYLIPWSPRRGGLDARRKRLVGDVRGLEEFHTARDITFTRKGDLLVWVAGRALHLFDFKTQTASTHYLLKGLLGDPISFDGERALFFRHEYEGTAGVVYDARTGKRRPGGFPPGKIPGHVLAMQGGSVYVLEREKAADKDGRHAHRVSAYDLKRGGARNPLRLLLLKADSQRAYVHRLYFRGHLFLWDEDGWESVPVD